MTTGDLLVMTIEYLYILPKAGVVKKGVNECGVIAPIKKAENKILGLFYGRIIFLQFAWRVKHYFLKLKINPRVSISSIAW